MQLELSQDIQDAILARVNRGEFSTPDDVVRAAMAQLDEFNATVADINQSLADEEAGRVHSLKDVDSELRKSTALSD